MAPLFRFRRDADGAKSETYKKLRGHEAKAEFRRLWAQRTYDQMVEMRTELQRTAVEGSRHSARETPQKVIQIAWGPMSMCKFRVTSETSWESRVCGATTFHPIEEVCQAISPWLLLALGQNRG